MHFTLCLPHTCLDALHSVYFPRPCLYAVPCPLSLCLCLIVYVPCACLYACHLLLSMRMPLCVSLSTLPVHASIHFTVYLPCACVYALHSVLALRMLLLRVSLLLCALPLCISLSTFPAHASMHFTLRMHFTVYFPCACLCAPNLGMPLCISLSVFPAHPSTSHTVYSVHASMQCISVSTFRPCSRSCGDVLRVLLLYTKLRLCSRAAGTYFAHYFCTEEVRHAPSPQRVARTRQESQKRRTKTQVLHIDHADPRRGSHVNRTNRKNNSSFCTSTSATRASASRETCSGVLRRGARRRQ